MKTSRKTERRAAPTPESRAPWLRIAAESWWRARAELAAGGLTEDARLLAEAHTEQLAANVAELRLELRQRMELQRG